MVGYIIVRAIQIVMNLYLLVIFFSALLSFFLPPYHQVRVFLDKLVDPLLQPIRRVVPPLGTIDLSPMILFILVELTGSVVINLVSAML
jgi:YggT family protein